MRFRLELTDPGFDHTVLSEFRTRLVALTAEERFLEAVLALCKEHSWLKARGRPRTDSTHILAKIRALNRAACVVETLRYARNVLAVVAPDWLRDRVQPDGLERYGPRASEYRFPAGEDKRQQVLHQLGQHGWGLLSAITADPQSRLPAVYPSDRSITADLETRLRVSGRGRNLDCRAGSAGGSKMVLFALRP